MAQRLARVKNIIDTTANWQVANPVLLKGEIGLEIKSGGEIKFKAGDGNTSWNLLGYVSLTPSEISAINDELQSQIDEVGTEIDDAKLSGVSGKSFNTLAERLNSIEIPNVLKTYKTVNDMINDTTLVNGDVVLTSGYYVASDGGGAKYEIISGTPDNTDPRKIPSEHGFYAKQIDIGAINVLTIGVKRDGTEGDVKNHSIMQKLLYGMKANSSVAIYFPQGLYLFTDGITIQQSPEKTITFTGDTAGFGSYGYSTAKDSDFSVGERNASMILFKPSSGNVSFIKNSNKLNGFSAERIAFICPYGKFVKDADLESRTVEPYNPYSYTMSKEGVNGISVVAENFNVSECYFRGFTGYAVKLNAVNHISSSKFIDCNQPILAVGNDAIVENVYITQSRYGIAMDASTIFAYNIWIDQIVEYGIYGKGVQVSGIITGLIDHIGYAGVFGKSTNSLKLDLRIGRCGMYYADTQPEDIEVQTFEELSKSAFVAIKSVKNSFFNLNLYYRSIADNDNTRYRLPNAVFVGESWSKSQVYGFASTENFKTFYGFTDYSFLNDISDELRIDKRNIVNDITTDGVTIESNSDLTVDYGNKKVNLHLNLRLTKSVGAYTTFLRLPESAKPKVAKTIIASDVDNNIMFRGTVMTSGAIQLNKETSSNGLIIIDTSYDL